MDLNIYDDNGWLNMPAIIETNYPFIFIPGARGIGKTYGGLKYFVDHQDPIILLRRTQTEIDIQNDPKGDGTSFQPVLSDQGREWRVTRNKNIGYVWEGEQLLGINIALSTFANIRGAFDFSYINHVFYDEFIAEAHVKKIKNEGMALANFYESINRNRELKGRDPLQLICAANALNIANDVFMYFDITTAVEQMIQEGIEVKAIGNKLIILPLHSPISEKKAQTALYTAINSEFTDMAVNNKFVLNDFSYIKKRPLSEYRCLFRIGDLFIFEHKSRQEFYCTFKKGETKEVYQANYSGLEKMQRSRWKFAGYMLDGMISFESYRVFALFCKYFNLQ